MGSTRCAYGITLGPRQWPNRDPIGERGRINLYGFVQNGPINQVDFLGHSCIGDALGFKVVVGLGIAASGRVGPVKIGIEFNATPALIDLGISADLGKLWNCIF